MQEKKIKTATLLASIVLIIVSVFGILIILIYGFGVRNNIAGFAAKLIPFPAISIDGKNFISINQIQSNLEAIKRFYSKQDFSEIGMRVDFTTEEGKKRLKIKEKNLLNKMVENKIIETIANKKGLVITDSMVSAEVDQKIKELGNFEDLKKNIKNVYGWNVKDFEREIVKPDLYREKIWEKVKKENKEFSEAQNKIEKAKSELDEKKDFSSVAQKYSDGDSSKNGGDLGWFTYDQMLPEIALQVFKLEKGQTSGIIESSLGLHIIRILDKKNENNQDKIKVSQIFIRMKNFSDWLENEENKVKVKVFIKDYVWNAKNKTIEFSDEKMKKFDENLQKNSSGDISVLF